MPISIFTELSFAAAHWLPQVPVDHKCRQLHGHTFSVLVTVSGPVDPEAGWVMDFKDVEDAVRSLVGQLDHQCLNDVPGLENPTSEAIVGWFADRLLPVLPGLAAVTVKESAASGCTWNAR